MDSWGKYEHGNILDVPQTLMLLELRLLLWFIIEISPTYNHKCFILATTYFDIHTKYASKFLTICLIINWRPGFIAFPIPNRQNSFN